MAKTQPDLFYLDDSDDDDDDVFSRLPLASERICFWTSAGRWSQTSKSQLISVSLGTVLGTVVSRLPDFPVFLQVLRVLPGLPSCTSVQSYATSCGDSAFVLIPAGSFWVQSFFARLADVTTERRSAMPFMFDTTHQQRVVKRHRAVWENVAVIEK